MNLNQTILWVGGPLFSAYILLPNFNKLLKAPKEYWLYVSLIIFSFTGFFQIIDTVAFLRYVKIIISNFLVMLIIYYSINNIKEWLLLWKTLWLVAIVICAFSFFEISNETKGANIDYFRLSGLTGNANGTANYARIGVVSTLLLLQILKDRLWIPLFVASIVFLSYVTLLTASRGNFVNIIFVLGTFIGLRYFSGWRLVLIVLTLLLGGNFLIKLSQSFLQDFYLYDRLTQNESIADAFQNEPRLILYSTAWKIFLNHPIFGVGLGQFPLYNPSRLMTHTDFLDIFVQLGILAGTTYLIIYWRVYKGLNRVYKHMKKIGKHRIAQLLLICFISELIYGFTNPNWFSTAQMIVLSLLIVYVYKIGEQFIIISSIPHSPILHIKKYLDASSY